MYLFSNYAFKSVFNIVFIFTVKLALISLTLVSTRKDILMVASLPTGMLT